MANAYSQNLGLIEPTPGDPSSSGTWGVLLNTNAALLDSAVAGILNLSVAGASTVILTSNQGAADQSRNQHFNLSGALAGNINVLWPQSKSRMFSVTNNTTGSFTLSCGANNGSGTPAGSTVAVPQGSTLQLYSDGTNITVRPTQPSGSAGGDLGGNWPNPTVTQTHLSSPLPTDQGGVPTGSLMPYAGLNSPGGWLFCDGQPISRSTYATLFNAITIQQNGTLTNGSEIVTGLSDTSLMAAGMPIGGTGVPAGTTILSVDSSTQIHLSQNATVSGAEALVIAPHGVGDGSTTFNKPDFRGRSPFGLDNMGGSAANRVTSAGSGINGVLLGAAGGSQFQQAHDHDITDNGHIHDITDNGHIHNFPNNASLLSNVVGNQGNNTGSPVTAEYNSTASAPTGIGINNAKTGISIQNAGSGSSQNMPPGLMCNIIIKT